MLLHQNRAGTTKHCLTVKVCRVFQCLILNMLILKAESPHFTLQILLMQKPRFETVHTSQTILHDGKKQPENTVASTVLQPLGQRSTVHENVPLIVTLNRHLKNNSRSVLVKCNKIIFFHIHTVLSQEKKNHKLYTYNYDRFLDAITTHRVPISQRICYILSWQKSTGKMRELKQPVQQLLFKAEATALVQISCAATTKTLCY